MANHGCINGTLDDIHYSFPVPVIGVYIATSTLVCMLLMIYDTLVGFFSKKCWLPCKLFKLNSITLTLVLVAVKLTVDLTTPMPSVKDQLSKLCGTCFLCAYMGFILPSIGVMNDLTNMYSLSILVVTVFVNMCIQISTGVVVLFIPEHIIILCVMLILLGMLWSTFWKLKVVTERTRETTKNVFMRSKKTVLERLKICYQYGYGSNTQFIACKEFTTTSVGALNIFCLAILIHAAYRSVITKGEKFSRGNSDYDWSMPIIVVTQILTVIVGSFVSLSRWLTMIGHHCLFYYNMEEPYVSNPIWKISVQAFRDTLIWVTDFYMVIITFPISVLAFVIELVKEGYKSGNNSAAEEFMYLIDDNIGIDEWTLKWALINGLTEMEKEIEVSKSEPNELFRLLSKINPSQQLLVDYISSPNGEGIPISTLSVVLLVRIAQVSLPKDLNSFLVKTFREVFEILCFIEESLYSTSLESAKKLEVAKAVWLADDFSHLVLETFDRCAKGSQTRYYTNRALAIIAEVKSKMPADMIHSEQSMIENYINRRQYSYIKELYDVIEQLYVDMLHVILAQFPTATFNALTVTPDDDYHERVRLALKFVCKIERLEDRIEWKFPQGCNLLGLITSPVLAEEEEDNAAVITNP